MDTVFATVAAVEATEVDAFQRVRAGAVPQCLFHLYVCPRLRLHHALANHVLLVQSRVLYANDLRSANTELGGRNLFFSAPMNYLHQIEVESK